MIEINNHNYKNDPNYKLKNSSISNINELIELCMEILNDFCLQIVFVSRQLFLEKNGTKTMVLGGSPTPFQERDNKAGICMTRHKRGYSGNVLILTNKGRYNSLATRSLRMVTGTHEIAHAFGADHVKIDKRLLNGRYLIMAPSTAKPRYLDQMIFTEENKDHIRNILFRQSSCFREWLPHCGNGIKEHGEECDCGDSLAMCSVVDPCCNPAGYSNACRFKEGSLCHPYEPCCKYDCQLTARIVMLACNDDCFEESYCDGVSAKCPSSNFTNIGEYCADCGAPICLCDGRGNCRS
jgi:hypothetical protein